VTIDTVCVLSEDVVTREIEGEIVIVPLVAGIGNADDELYTLNETGRAVWQRLDGKRALGQLFPTSPRNSMPPRPTSKPTSSDSPGNWPRTRSSR
jgi:hypothetical protein